jgi:hypothetical protein
MEIVTTEGTKGVNRFYNHVGIVKKNMYIYMYRYGKKKYYKVTRAWEISATTLVSFYATPCESVLQSRQLMAADNETKKMKYVNTYKLVPQEQFSASFIKLEKAFMCETDETFTEDEDII